MSELTVSLGIRLDTACDYEECSELAWPLYTQLDSGKYDRCSVVNLQPVDDWRAEHRTARKRADRCERRGYMFARVNRHEWSEDVHAINTSAMYRQGRPMSVGYQTYHEFEPLPRYPCRSHAVRTYGVLEPNGAALVAYLWLYRARELGLVSQILGHADHLENEVMYLLMQGVMAAEHATDPHGYLVYNRHDSGTDGLRFYKERCGFVEMDVTWLP